MKKNIVLLFFVIFVSQIAFSATRSYQTYTPFTPQQYNAYNNPYYYNRQYYNNPYYYDDSYYNMKKKSIRRKINDFFSSGNITGFTPSYNDSFDSPYGYQQGWNDSRENYYYNNYNQQNGMSVKIMD